MQLPKTIDRSIARMVALKRLVTGTLALIAGFIMLYVASEHGGAPPPAMIGALLIFFVGGGWTLRDGLRLRRELQR
jgi:hypothetical protein